jgi:hypothetical protein
MAPSWRKVRLTPGVKTPSSLFMSLVRGSNFGEARDESCVLIFFTCGYNSEAACVLRERKLPARLPIIYAAQSFAAVHLVIMHTTTQHHSTVPEFLGIHQVIVHFCSLWS